jgi:hypothetical protein
VKHFVSAQQTTAQLLWLVVVQQNPSRQKLLVDHFSSLLPLSAATTTYQTIRTAEMKEKTVFLRVARKNYS